MTETQPPLAASEPVRQPSATSRRTAVRADVVVPMDTENRVIEDGVVVFEDGRILAVEPASEVDTTGIDCIRLSGHMLLPGLINCHTHIPGSSAFRGILEDGQDAFYKTALTAERHLGEEEAYRFALLGAVECLSSGFTFVNEHYHHGEFVTRAISETGLRAHVAHTVTDVDLSYIYDRGWEFDHALGDRNVEAALALFDKWHGAGDGRIHVRLGAHAPDTCSPELLRRLRDLGAERGIGHHLHAAQTPREKERLASAYNRTAVELLDEVGLLGPDTILAHVKTATAEDHRRLGETRTAIAHAPKSVLKSGMFPLVEELYSSGAPVGWATDWITMDPFDAMRLAVYGARLTAGRVFLPAYEALSHFTREAAVAMRMDHAIGSLESGKRADIVAIDLEQPHLAPALDPVGAVVYNGSGRDVTHVWVDGEMMIEDRRAIRVDERALIADARRLATRLWDVSGMRSIRPARPACLCCG